MGADEAPVASDSTQAIVPHAPPTVAKPNDKKLASFSYRQNTSPDTLPMTYHSMARSSNEVGSMVVFIGYLRQFWAERN